MHPLTDDRSAAPAAAARPRSSAAALTAGVLLIVALAAAVSVDVVRSGFGVKGDEATYVAMGLSMAYDGDLTYERRDLDRFWGIYKQGPEGIFLKRGKQLRVRLRPSPPFVFIFNNTPDSRADRLYFGKAMIYSVAAAPFVRFLGMNGFLVFHVLLLFATLVCGYRFLTASGSQPTAALVFALAFVGATAMPAQAVFLTPEIFNYAIVFIAYFFWLYKEVAQPRAQLLRGPSSDLLAAILLGAATYSKPHNGLLVLPLVLLLWWRRQWWRGLSTGAVAVAAACLLFAATALISGEFNYQGGERKTFYSAFPFDAPDATWERRGLAEATDDLGAQDSLVPSEIVRMLIVNATYFPFGRHFGFVPYYFPGALALILWALSSRRFERWRLVNFIGIVLSTIAILVIFPYTWSGGGGPPGNRYYIGIYPAFFFLTPPLQSTAPALLAWIGGALFTAKILVNPFVSAKNTWEITERGFARRLPVELTMANDLPVRLAQPLRGHIQYSHDPFVLLYFLDPYAFPPEPIGQAEDGSTRFGIWVSGSGRADIIVRSERPLDHLRVTAFTPIPNTFIVSAGGPSTTMAMMPEQTVTFDVPTVGAKGFRSYAYLLSARSMEGFTPRLRDAGSGDNRNLGVMMQFQAVEK